MDLVFQAVKSLCHLQYINYLVLRKLSEITERPCGSSKIFLLIIILVNIFFGEKIGLIIIME